MATRRLVARDDAAHFASEPPGLVRLIARGGTLVARVAAPRLRVDSAPVSGLGHIERLIHGHDVFAIHPPLEPPVLTPSCLVSPSFRLHRPAV